MSRTEFEWRSLRTRISEHRVQLSLSLRVTIASLLSFAVSHLLHIPLPLWTVLTAIILTQVSFGRSVKATIDYLVGTVGGAIYTGAVAALVPHTNEFWLAGSLALAIAPLALLAATYPSFTAATFTAALVLLVPGIAHVGPIESALYRVVEVAIGGVTALTVSLLIFPIRAQSLAIETAAKMLILTAQSLPQLIAGFMQARDATDIGRLQDSIGQAFSRLDAVDAEAKHERINFLAAGPGLGPLLRTLLRLRHDLIIIGRAATVPLPEVFQKRLGPDLGRVADTVADYLRRSGEALVARHNPPSLDAVNQALDSYAEALAAARREGLTQSLAVDAVERVFALGFALEQIRHNLRDLERCGREIAGAGLATRIA
jgi:uncharacterized membrane protein YccC